MTIEAKAVEELLNPTSVAVVGASDRSVWAGAIVENLRRWRFPGELHLVNSARDRALGQVCYPSLREVPGPVDHAVIVTPAATVPAILADCADLGIRAATVVASGFHEAGAAGAARGDEITEFCRSAGIALLGPNCFGFVNFPAATVMSRMWLEGPPEPGPVSAVVQSGQLSLSLYGSAYSRGVGLRYLVSSGNEMVVDANHFFAHFLEDEQTRVICGVLERIPDPPAFERIALDALSVGKPTVVCKLGASDAGRRAVAAHTAAVAGERRVLDTFLRECGVVVVEDIDELVETAGVLANVGPPRGGRTVYLAGSGGAGGLFSDLAERTAVDLVELSPPTRGRVAELLGQPADGLLNPLDLGTAGFAALPQICEVLAADPDLDLILAHGQEPLSSAINGTEMVAALESHMAAARRLNDSGTWMCLHTSTDRDPTEFGRAISARHRAPYLHGRVGMRALDNVIRYGSSRHWLATDLAERLAARSAHHSARTAELGDGVLSEWESLRMLREFDVPTVPARLCESLDQARGAAADLGYPVVLKVVSPDIAHKSDIGGVVTGITGRAELDEAYAGVLAGAREHAPEARIDGVLVCSQLRNALEMFVGVTVDPAVGPMVAVGLGGVFVEVFDDVALALPPFDTERAERLLRSLRCWPLLDGARGAERPDVRALAELLSRFSRMAAALGDEVREIDVNPVMVLHDGAGAWAADALVVFERD
jgi:acyl-CoA synthetase (NDP forming)